MRIRFMRVDRSTKQSRDEAWERHARNPSEESRAAVIEQNIPMAVQLANRLGTSLGLPAADIDDLVGVACLTLIRAVDRFDASLGYQFSTYAWVAIKRGLYASVPQIRGVGTRHYTLASKRWVALYQDLERDLGRPPNNEEMRTALGYSSLNYERLRVAVMAVAFGIEPLGSVHESMNPSMVRPTGSLITSHQLDVIEDFETRDLVDTLIAGLPPRTQEMVRLNLFEGIPQHDLAERYGVSRQRVQQAMKSAFDRMRQRLEARGVKSACDILERRR